MKRIWSDENKFKTWEKVEIAVAEVKPQPGGIDTIEQYEDFVNRVL